DDVSVDTLRNACEAHDRIAAPVAAGDAHVVERYRLVQGPAQRLHDAALDLIADAVGIDGVAAVDYGDNAHDIDTAAFAVDVDFHCHRRIRAKILVAREPESAAAALPGLALREKGVPAEALRGHANDVLCARIPEVPQPERHRIELG